MDCKNPPGNNITPKPEIGKDVLESLFNIHEVPHIRTYASGNMDWRKIAKNLQNGQDFEFHSKAMSATRHNPKNGKIEIVHEFEVY